MAVTERLRPALVVGNINMPKVSGIDATARIKAEHARAQISRSTQRQLDGDARSRPPCALLTKETAVERLLYL